MSVAFVLDDGRNATTSARLDPRDPMGSARTIVGVEYTHRGQRTLHHQNGQFYEWDGAAYRPVDDALIRKVVWEQLDESLHGAKPTTNTVSNVVDALRAVCNLHPKHTAPCWLDAQAGDPAPQEIIAMPNGLLHAPTRKVFPPTPRFYTHSALDFSYDSDAPPPESWLQFLASVLPDDQQAIDTLQEIFGYMLMADTSQQKIFLLIGPKRSGKGTIARVLTAMIGQSNVCTPMLATMTAQFGLQPLIGKTAAIISDARLGSRADQAAIAERLLCVSGEDGMTIDRKHLPPWNGTLRTRFFVMSNELPRIADTSGALASRFIVLITTQSFYGKEDPNLTAKLLKDLPGILKWALDGYDRLRRRGHFLQPDSASEAIAELDDLGSPTGAFVRDRCIVDPMQSATVDELFDEWKRYCESEGRDHPGTRTTFGRDLRTVVGSLKTRQLRKGEKRIRIFDGIGLA